MPLAGGKRYRGHPVIRNQKMVSASHDLMGGIVKQVFQIKFQFQFRLQIIGKIGFHQINGSGKIEPVIPQVDQNHPFFKRKRTGAAVVKNPESMIGEQRKSQKISFVCFFSVRN